VEEKNMTEGLLIKELSKKLDMNPKTIRFYEDIGVIPKAERNVSNYRIYTQNDVKRLGFVKKARELGLTIENIKNIMSIREKGNLPGNEVVDLLEKESVDLEQKIKEMIAFKEKLDKCIKNFKKNINVCSSGDICGLIEILFE
jgi:MerR family Zn(II)-responsive transcriptional regulator of zntA